MGRTVARGRGSAAAWGRGVGRGGSRATGPRCGEVLLPLEFHRPCGGGLRRDQPGRELGKRRRNPARRAPSPELRRPELSLGEGRTSPPTFASGPPRRGPRARLRVRGGLGIVLLALLVVTPRGLTPPTPAPPFSCEIFVFLKTSFLRPWP